MLLDEYENIPYKVLNFLGSAINYGGRVTDSTDVRLIEAILANFMNADVLSDEYKFSPSGIYMSLPAGEWADYDNNINHLPLNPTPEIFGMHDNAEITNA